jgi:hypothetical protein
VLNTCRGIVTGEGFKSAQLYHKPTRDCNMVSLHGTKRTPHREICSPPCFCLVLTVSDSGAGCSAAKIQVFLRGRDDQDPFSVFPLSLALAINVSELRLVCSEYQQPYQSILKYPSYSR